MTDEEDDDNRIRVLTQLNLAVEWIRSHKDSIKCGPSIVICARNVVIRFGYSTAGYDNATAIRKLMAGHTFNVTTNSKGDKSYGRTDLETGIEFAWTEYAESTRPNEYSTETVTL